MVRTYISAKCRILMYAMLAFILLPLPGCSSATHTHKDSSRLKITTTIFAAYDAARSVCGDCADISMLMAPGSEIHSYEPTPRDIINILESDIFICAGGEGDVWVDSILESVDTSGLTIIRMMDCTELLEEEIIEGMETHEDEDSEEDEAEWDEHVWVTPGNMTLICETIADTCIALDAEHADRYKANLSRQTAMLNQLDNAFRSCIDNAPLSTIIFADRFPVRYFTEEYGLSYYAAFPGCSDNTEASASTVAFLIKKVRAEKIPVVFMVELGNGKLAAVVSAETGATVKTFYSGHNISADDYNLGITYIDLMQRNLDALNQALYPEDL